MGIPSPYAWLEPESPREGAPLPTAYPTDSYSCLKTQLEQYLFCDACPGTL